MALPDDVRTWVFNHNFEFWSATLGLSAYTGAFMAEVIRAGLQAIPKGLLEAAYSSGLGYFQALRTIILPLAFRVIIPPLGSEFLNNMKNSSLAMVVGVAELCWQSQQVESLTFKGFEATTAATLLYLWCRPSTAVSRTAWRTSFSGHSSAFGGSLPFRCTGPQTAASVRCATRRSRPRCAMGCASPAEPGG
jgi:ABC-type amino acid transport system permease subunit